MGGMSRDKKIDRPRKIRKKTIERIGNKSVKSIPVLRIAALYRKKWDKCLKDEKQK